MRLKLDSKAVGKLTLPPDLSEQIYWDTDLPGFGLRLRGESRNFVAQYRVRGRQRRAIVGDAKKIDVIQARKAAKRVLAEVELGGDPQGAKEEARRQAVHTLRSVAESYLEAKAKVLRPASYKVTKLYLTGAYFKPLHSTTVTAITRADVAARFGAITRGSGSVTGKQARAALSSMFKWAMGEGLTDNNPVIGTNVPAGPTARKRVLTDAELVSVWRACDGENDFNRIVRLLILLGCRRAEAGGMRWSEINVEAATWDLPGERAKNKQDMTVPLSPAALAIIKAVPQASRDQLFGARAEVGFTEWDSAKRALDERLGDTVAEFRLHDLRRSVSTKMADDLGVFPHIIETILNHAGGHKAGTAGIYNRAKYTAEVRNAMLRWSEHVLALAEDRESKIIPLRA